jgi:hypothetical protein
VTERDQQQQQQWHLVVGGSGMWGSVFDVPNLKYFPQIVLSGVSMSQHVVRHEVVAQLNSASALASLHCQNTQHYLALSWSSQFMPRTPPCFLMPAK